jgi:diguanylate cyclase (GGDEF)-like protein
LTGLLAGAGAVAGNTTGERPHLRVYSVGQGLTQSQVTAIHFDRERYAWFGTMGGGVSRFDGLEFTSFGPRHGLGGNTVHAIRQDTAGTLWVATDGGLSRQREGRWTTLGTADGLSAREVLALADGPDGCLWIGTSQGIDRLCGERLQTWAPAGRTRVNALLWTRSGNLWIGRQGEDLLRFDGRELRLFGLEDGLPSTDIRDLVEDSQGRLWVATGAGARIFARERFDPGGTEGLDGLRVNSLLEDRRGRLWFATTHGVAHLSDGRLTTWGMANGLPTRQVRAVAQDPEGGIWFGTDGGAVHLANLALVALGRESSLVEPAVMAIARDASDRLRVGTERGAAVEVHGRLNVDRRIEAFSDGGVRCLLLDSRNRFWLGTGSGALVEDGAGLRSYGPADGLPPGPVHAIVEDGFGRIWFGSRWGASRYDGQNFERFLTDTAETGAWVTDIHRDQSGRLWFATDRGLLEFDGASFASPADLDASLRSARIVAISEDSRGNLWLGTHNDGLVRFTPAISGVGATVRIGVDQGLSDDKVYFLLFDHEDQLWIGTRRGLDRLDTRTLDSSSSLAIRHYGEAEGYIGVESNLNAAFQDQDGSLWFGTIEGALRYTPGEDHPELAPPVVKLTGMEVEGKPYHPGLDSALQHRQNDVAFRFVSPSFAAPETLTYQYKLEGLDADWGPPVGSRFARFPNLPPGRFHFRVRACTGPGTCSPVPAAYGFTVLAPFWRTWWFYLAAVTLFALSVGGGVRLRLLHLNAQKRRLQAAVEARTEELAKANRELDRLARVDGLTGVYNRRAAMERLAELRAAGTRRGGPLTAILVDIDHFKRINDERGHDAGDTVLAEVATRLAATKRTEDFLARYGGEEFILLLPGDRQEGAAVLTHRLRRAISGEPIAAAEGPPLKVTASFGVAGGEEVFEVDEVIRRADAALYEAKRLGRDRVVVADPPPASPTDPGAAAGARRDARRAAPESTERASGPQIRKA